MPHDISADDWLGWEIDGSTRVNTHLWTKWAPVDVTLTTAGTAQDLFTTSTELPVVNLVTNPSMETGTPPTGYTAVGATLTQSATVARSGTYSLSIDPDNSAAGEGAYWATDDVSGKGLDINNRRYLTVSVYLQDNTDTGRTARVEIRDSTGATTHSSGNEITLSSSWQRSVASFQLPVEGAAYRIYIVTSSAASDEVFYADDFMIQLQHDSTVRTYCDGDQGLNYEWDGTANASVSRRRGGLVAVRGYNLSVTRNTLIAFDHTASSTVGRRVIAGTDFWNDQAIHVRSNISMINEIAGELPRVYGEILGVHMGKQS